MLDRRVPCVPFPEWFRLGRLPLAVLASTLLFGAAPVHASAVAIVRPHTPSPELAETLSRLHGELLSVGLEVEIAQRPDVPGLATTHVCLFAFIVRRSNHRMSVPIFTIGSI